MALHCSSSFPIDPQFSCQQSQLLCSSSFAQRLWPSRLLFVTLCLCFRSVGNHIQCTPPFMFGGDLLFCVQTIHARTETADIYLSSSCLERPHKASPWGGVLNKYLLRPTMSEFKMPSWQKEPWCVLKSEKQKPSIQISMFLHFPETTGKTLYFTLDINWLLHNSSTQSELKHFEHFGKKTKKTDW